MDTVVKLTAVMTAMLCFVSSPPSVKAQTDYCSICSDQTLCQYQGDGAACVQVRSSGTSDDDIGTIVDEHNKYRNTVASGSEQQGNPGPQPSAANMNKLEWDDELASVAQRWADQCAFGHDSCRNVERFSVGQNVYGTWTTGDSSGPDWVDAVRGWYDEVQSFDGGAVGSYVFSESTGHYTQVVWADTRYVGCGYKGYVDSSGQNADYYVCNYGPAGNVIGLPMYTVGDSCSSCDNGCDGTYGSLCA